MGRSHIPRAAALSCSVEESFCVEAMHRRVETTPKQQLAELRRAYEHYTALAEQLKDGVNSATDVERQRALAQDACRIAAAYKKSVANSCTRMETTFPSKEKSPSFTHMTTGLILIVAFIAGGVFIYRPVLFRHYLPVSVKPMVSKNRAVAIMDVAPYVPAAVKPILSAPASPERSGSALGPGQEADGRQLVGTAKSAVPGFQTAIRFKAHKKPGTLAKNIPVLHAGTVTAPPVPAKSATAALGSADTTPASAAVPSPAQTATMSKQLLPTSSPDTDRSTEQGVTQVEVSISAAGAIADCRVVQTSGSPRLDASTCFLVKRTWQWPPLIGNSQPTSSTTNVSVIWNLRTAK